MIRSALARKSFIVAAVSLCMLGATSAWAQVSSDCPTTYAALKAALDSAVQTETSGLNLHMWASVVARDGSVCAVAFSGNTSASQWLGSRVISAQKANTANLFSLDNTSSSNGSGAATGLSLSTANLYSA